MRLIPRTTTAVIVLGIVIGLAVGLGTHTFLYAKGWAYLTNNPQACAECHIMEDHYSAWLKSSHHTVATCNDCHTPHPFVAKYASKAYNGFFHSLAFTTGDFPDPLQIKSINRKITEHACVECHEGLVGSIGAHPEGLIAAVSGPSPGNSPDKVSCIRCHFDVGHPMRESAAGFDVR